MHSNRVNYGNCMRKTRNNITSLFFCFMSQLNIKQHFRYHFPMQVLDKYGFLYERVYLKARDFRLRFSPAFLRQTGFLNKI